MAAYLSANAAVLVMLGVAFALLATGTECHDTRLNHWADDADIGRGLSCHNAVGGIAHVGAVEAEPNAADQLLYVALT